MLLRSQHLVAFTVLLAISITVKWDTVVLPGLYLLANLKLSNWISIVLKSTAMFIVGFAVLIGMRILLPGGFDDSRPTVTQLLINLSDFRATPISYPPLLVFLVPIILAFLGLRWSDRFSRMSVGFGLLLFLPLLVASNFVEVRAHTPILVLLLPSTLPSRLYASCVNQTKKQAEMPLQCQLWCLE